MDKDEPGPPKITESAEPTGDDDEPRQKRLYTSQNSGGPGPSGNSNTLGCRSMIKSPEDSKQ